MAGIEELILGMGYEEKQELVRRQTKFLTGQRKILGEIATRLEAKNSVAEEVKKQLVATYQPDGNGGFLEVEGFAGFNSLQFFYDMGKFLDKTFSPILAKLPKIERTARTIVPDSDTTGPSLLDLLDDAKSFAELLHETCKIREQGIFPF